MSSKENMSKANSPTALTDDDLDDVVGAGPLSDAAYAAGRMAGKIGSKTMEVATDTANKVVGAAGALAKDASNAGDALLDGINDGMGGGDEEGGDTGDTDTR
ncbi:MAG: hypothetical protein KDE55_06320 [Novosphingobium sp.]|nr:hypothetical protein [Novosphingobium sp.]